MGLYASLSPLVGLILAGILIAWVIERRVWHQ